MSDSTTAIETLLAQLHHSDTYVRADAARRLGQTRDPRAVDALLQELLAADWRARRNAAQALGAARDRRAVEPLIEALKDSTATVRCRAAVALGRLKDARAIAPLTDTVLTTDNPQLRLNAALALRKFGQTGVMPLVEAWQVASPPLRHRLLPMFAEMAHPAALQPLIDTLADSDPAVRQEAARALGKIGDRRAVEPLLDALDLTATASPDTGPEIYPMKRIFALQQTQEAIVRGLGQIGDARAITPLLSLLRGHEINSPHGYLYRAVTEALQQLSGLPRPFGKILHNDLGSMMGLLSDDQRGLLKSHLDTMRDNFAVFFGALSNQPDDPQKMDVTAKFLHLLEGSKAAAEDEVETLLGWLASDSALTRMGAAVSLPWYMDDRACEPLRAATNDSDANVRMAAGWALRTLENTLALRHP